MVENSTFLASSLGGGALLGGVLGYAVKKVVKIVLFVMGLEVGLLTLLEQQGVINVNWDVITSWTGPDTGALAPVFTDMALSTGIAGGGFAGGFMVGYKKG
jgi:uncharacterized membrane protein (Fun14 family)